MLINVMRKVTTPKILSEYNLWNHFTGNKYLFIICGNCGHSWDEKVTTRDICSAICPCCGAQNKWSHVVICKQFEKYLEGK